MKNRRFVSLKLKFLTEKNKVTLFLSFVPPGCLETEFLILVKILQNRSKKSTKMKKKTKVLFTKNWVSLLLKNLLKIFNLILFNFQCHSVIEFQNQKRAKKIRYLDLQSGGFSLTIDFLQKLRI